MEPATLVSSSFGPRGVQACDDALDPAMDRDGRVKQDEHLLRRQPRGPQEQDVFVHLDAHVVGQSEGAPP